MTLKRGWGLLAVMLGLLLLGNSYGWGATQEEIDKKIEQTKKKLIQAKIQENSVLGNLINTQRELDKISSNLNQLNDRLGNTERRMAGIRAQLAAAQHQLDLIQLQVDGRKTVMNARLVALYKYGYQSYLEALITAKNFGEFVSRFDMVGNYVRHDLTLIKTMQQQQQQIVAKRQEIEKKQLELEVQKNTYTRLHNKTKQEQNRWSSAVQTKQRELAAIQNDRQQLERALDELEQTSKNMESQIRGLQSGSKSLIGSGKYIWPVPGTITSYFGNRVHPILRKVKYHTGIDIGAPMGTRISASDTGVVIFSSTNGGYGKMIAIDHGAGISTVYAHCSVLLVGSGQTVVKGQLIAQVGSTGFSTGPHLHFEVRKDGIPVDPLNYL